MFRALDWLLDSIAPILPKSSEDSALDATWVPSNADGSAACEAPLGIMLAKPRRAAENNRAE